MNCCIDNCKNSVYIKNKQLCRGHYKRYWRYGDNFNKDKIKDTKLTLNERIAISYDVNKNGCHEWIGTIGSNGYALISINGKNAIVHRLLYKQKYGDIPNALMVCHKCDNRKCINLKHLFLGTAKENTQDMIIKNRGYNKKGITPEGFRNQIEKVKKLNVVQVKEIKDFLKNGMRLKSISQKYNVSYSCISDIKHKRSWFNI